MKRVLFVDDEQHVLDGLRDSLRRQRREWTMVFALGGRAALHELDAGPFDVVVTDMRMPDIDGAALLAHVRERHPASVRIMLSGQTELEAALRAVPVAHQFLSKPCDRERLRAAIERACLSQALLMDESVRRAAGGAEALPSAPTLYTRLVEASRDPDASMAHVGALVESDVAMCAKVLQLVNSSFFGLGRRIAGAREAVTYLGMAPLRALVLSTGAFQAFAAGRACGFSLDALEAHSTLVARTSAALLTDRQAAGEAFTAGMLHDVGKLVLASHRPAELAGLLAEAERTDRPLHVVERERGGVTHAEIGGYLLTVWGLPYTIVEAVTHHHAPARLEDSTFGVRAAVHIADALVGEASGGPAVLDEDYVARLGVADRLDGWRELVAGRLDGALAHGGSR